MGTCVLFMYKCKSGCSCVYLAVLTYCLAICLFPMCWFFFLYVYILNKWFLISDFWFLSSLAYIIAISIPYYKYTNTALTHMKLHRITFKRTTFKMQFSHLVKYSSQYCSQFCHYPVNRQRVIQNIAWIKGYSFGVMWDITGPNHGLTKSMLKWGHGWIRTFYCFVLM